MDEMTPLERAQYDERTAWAYGRPAVDAEECDGPEDASRRAVEDAQREELAANVRTAAATAANVRRGLDNKARELAGAGFLVVPPQYAPTAGELLIGAGCPAEWLIR